MGLLDAEDELDDELDEELSTMLSLVPDIIEMIDAERKDAFALARFWVSAGVNSKGRLLLAAWFLRLAFARSGVGNVRVISPQPLQVSEERSSRQPRWNRHSLVHEEANESLRWSMISLHALHVDAAFSTPDRDGSLAVWVSWPDCTDAPGSVFGSELPDVVGAE